MSKKKAVDLNVPPLTPVVLGEVKKPKFVALKVIILLGLFGALIFYLPEIVPIIDKYLVEWGLKQPEYDPSIPSVVPPVVDPNKPGEKQEEKDEVTKYTISENTSIDLTKEYGVTLSEISYAEDVLSFKVTPKEAVLSLSEKKLYVAIYKADDILTDYIKLSGIITSDAPASYTFKTTGAIKISVQVLEESDYPLYDIAMDEKGNSKFTCKKGNESLGYTFLNDELIQVDYTISILKTDPKYDELYTKYNELYIKHKELKGVVASFKTTTEDLKYNVTVNYENAVGALEFEKLYTKGTKANLIMFELKSEQYNCS